MRPDQRIHPVQAQVLRELLLRPKARFTELNTTRLSSYHFTFHVRALIDAGLIEKAGASYCLTTHGKEFANRFDTERVELERQAKVGALVVPVRLHKGEREVLVQQRLKHPYYGYHGFVTGKIRWGETLAEGAARELYEETGLRATLTLVGVWHKIDRSAKDRSLLEDKIFFVFRATRCRGVLRQSFEGGTNRWVRAVDLPKVSRKFERFDEALALAYPPRMEVAEGTYFVTDY